MLNEEVNEPHVSYKHCGCKERKHFSRDFFLSEMEHKKGGKAFFYVKIWLKLLNTRYINILKLLCLLFIKNNYSTNLTKHMENSDPQHFHVK